MFLRLLMALILQSWVHVAATISPEVYNPAFNALLRVNVLNRTLYTFCKMYTSRIAG